MSLSCSCEAIYASGSLVSDVVATYLYIIGLNTLVNVFRSFRLTSWFCYPLNENQSVKKDHLPFNITPPYTKNEKHKDIFVQTALWVFLILIFYT